MIDVSAKFLSLRWAAAEGFLRAQPATIERIFAKQVPKGDVLEVARAAGIAAAKGCSDLIVFCHPIPLDWVEVSFSAEQGALRVICEARSVWKTGVEVEAVAGVTGALLNAYDMVKPLDNSLTLDGIRVLDKRGGKGDFTDQLPEPVATAVLVISDSTHAGKRKDRSGRIIKEFLDQQQGVTVHTYEVLPDDRELIAGRLRRLADEEGVRLIITTGGTGLGPRDVTPEATADVIDRQVPGIAEAVRRHGRDRTPYAMLSRGLAGVRRGCLIVNLPGSSKGAKEGLDALFPGLLHIFPMLAGAGHPHARGNKP